VIGSFRELIDWLDGRGELARVSRAVDPVHELTRVLRKTQQGPNVGLLFENVKGSPTPVASNVLTHRATIAAALGLNVEELLAQLAARELAPLRPQQLSSAPVQEVVVDGPDLVP